MLIRLINLQMRVFLVHMLLFSVLESETFVEGSKEETLPDLNGVFAIEIVLQRPQTLLLTQHRVHRLNQKHIRNRLHLVFFNFGILVFFWNLLGQSVLLVINCRTHGFELRAVIFGDFTVYEGHLVRFDDFLTIGGTLSGLCLHIGFNINT